MTSKLSRLYRRGVAAVVCCTTLASVSFDALAAPPGGLDAFNDRSPASAGELPRAAKPNTGVVGKLNPSVLSAPLVDLTLADGTKLQARLERIARDDKKGTQSWIGTFDDAPGSVLVLSRVNGVVTGFANYKDQVLEIMPAVGGKHLLYAVDDARLPQGDLLRRTPPSAQDALSPAVSDFGTGASALTAADAVVQDVLVLYTAATANRYGQASIQSRSSRPCRRRIRRTRTVARTSR